MVVEHLAYKPQTWFPPALEKLPANMSVLWCRPFHDLDHLLDEWIRKTDHGGGVYKFEYFMGDNYNIFANVWLRPEYSANLAPYAAETGFRGVISLYLPIENWWRSSFNNWFFSRACWDAEYDLDQLLGEYCSKYYGDQAENIGEVFRIIFNELQPEPYKSPLETKDTRLDQVNEASVRILDNLEEIAGITTDEKIKLRIERIKTFTEYFRLHNQAFASLEMADLERLVQYAREHREHEPVLLYPEYVEGRNRNNFE
jgi:hypothetical protein